MNTQAVFVYGTLRQGGSNHFRMAGAEWVGRGKVEGVIHRIDLNRSFSYPALLEAEGKWVVGEVYRVDDSLLKNLDRYEGVSEPADPSDEYVRKAKTVLLDGGEEMLAWIWMWNRDVGQAVLIESGDWLDVEPNPS